MSGVVSEIDYSKIASELGLSEERVSRLAEMQFDDVFRMLPEMDKQRLIKEGYYTTFSQDDSLDRRQIVYRAIDARLGSLSIPPEFLTGHRDAYDWARIKQLEIGLMAIQSHEFAQAVSLKFAPQTTVGRYILVRW